MPIAVIDSSSGTAVTYYIHTGHLDEPQMMTNVSKAKVWDAYVTPFGSAKVFTTATANTDLRLPGQWYQAEAAGSGLNQNGYRDYDPTLGRYIEADPLGLGGGQNPYAYVDGQVYDYSDFWGLKPYQNYQKLDDAGIQSIKDINPRSIRENKEYGGAICKRNNGQYFYTRPQKGEETTVKIRKCPSGTNKVSFYHTHGDCIPGYDSENFSPDDMTFSDVDHMPSYLGTSKGRILRFIPNPMTIRDVRQIRELKNGSWVKP